MDIENLNSKATVKETTDVSGNVCDTVEKAAIADTFLENECSDLKATAAAMRKGISTERGKELSEAVSTADFTRDNLLTTLNFFVKSYQQWNKPETIGAANTIAKVIDTHGSRMARMSYEKESASLDAMLEKLDEVGMKTSIETINLTSLIDELKAAQSNFKVLYKQSAETESLKSDAVSPSSLRPLAATKLNSMINYLNVMSKANSAVYGAVAATVAELVNNLNGKIRSRYNDGKSDIIINNTSE